MTEDARIGLEACTSREYSLVIGPSSGLPTETFYQEDLLHETLNPVVPLRLRPSSQGRFRTERSVFGFGKRRSRLLPTQRSERLFSRARDMRQRIRPRKTGHLPPERANRPPRCASRLRCAVFRPADDLRLFRRAGLGPGN